jgi:DnaJ-class molecular chaperone
MGKAKNCVKRIGEYIELHCEHHLIVDYRSCKKCKGEKTVKETTRQEIHIERGMADRQRIVLNGAGDQEVPTSSV